jgi:hypothetical protein
MNATMISEPEIWLGVRRSVMKSRLMNFIVQTMLVCTGSSALADVLITSQGHMPIEAVDVIRLTGPDYDLLEQDSNLIAIETVVGCTAATRGTWEHLPDGQMLWRLRVLSPDAVHLSFGFHKFDMPETASLQAGTLDGAEVTCVYDASSPTPGGGVWTRILRSDEIIIAATMQPDDKRAFERGVELSVVNEGFRGFGGGSLSRTVFPCQKDVICPIAHPWRCEVKSVGMYTFQLAGGGMSACSGSLINNTSQDRRPLFLTAYHCIEHAVMGSIRVYWNFEHSVCRVYNSAEADDLGNGSLNQSTAGAQILVSGVPDMSLLELSGSPGADDATWAGWSRGDTAEAELSGGAAIHHPAFQEKRFSAVHRTYSAVGWWGGRLSHGVVAGGSSGSPLFDDNGRIRGQLYGHDDLGCSSENTHYYGLSLFYAWDSLQPYLDPGNSGSVQVDSLCSTNAWAGSCCLRIQRDGQDEFYDCLLDLTEAECDDMFEENSDADGYYRVLPSFYLGHHCDDIICEVYTDETPFDPCCIGWTCIDVSEDTCLSLGGTFYPHEDDGINWSCSWGFPPAHCQLDDPDPPIDPPGPDGCPGLFVEDCDGHCAPEVWIGDGQCDYYEFFWDQHLINFDCAAFDFDDGDCVEYWNCRVDINGDSVVNAGDVESVIYWWGQWVADIDGDGETGVTDLLMILQWWGSQCSE